MKKKLFLSILCLTTVLLTSINDVVLSQTVNGTVNGTINGTVNGRPLDAFATPTPPPVVTNSCGIKIPASGYRCSASCQSPSAPRCIQFITDTGTAGTACDCTLPPQVNSRCSAGIPPSSCLIACNPPNKAQCDQTKTGGARCICNPL